MYPVVMTGDHIWLILLFKIAVLTVHNSPCASELVVQNDAKELIYDTVQHRHCGPMHCQDSWVIG